MFVLKNALFSLQDQGIKFKDIEDLLKFLIDKKRRIPRMEECPEDFYGIISTCWVEDPSKRPTFVHLKEELDKYDTGTMYSPTVGDYTKYSPVYVKIPANLYE